MLRRPPPDRGDRDHPVLDRQLRALIDDHAEAAYRVAYGVLRDRGLAEDVVQETMVRAWESLDGFRGDSSLRTWVLRIAHNTAVSALRRRRDLATAPEDLPDRAGGDETAARADGRARVAALRTALAGLDELSRTIVVLREVEGLSYAQVAEALDVSVATVRTRLLRARRALQCAVELEAGSPGRPPGRPPDPGDHHRPTDPSTDPTDPEPRHGR